MLNEAVVLNQSEAGLVSWRNLCEIVTDHFLHKV